MVARAADTGYTAERPVARTNENVAHNIGNLVSRAVPMAQRYRNAPDDLRAAGTEKPGPGVRHPVGSSHRRIASFMGCSMANPRPIYTVHRGRLRHSRQVHHVQPQNLHWPRLLVR